MADPTVAILGTGPHGLGDGRATGRGGRRGRRLQPDRRARGRTRRATRRVAAVAPTPAEAARQADVVISMVADDDAVAALYRAPDGIIAGLRPGAVAVEMSTVLPDTIRSLAPDVRACGAGLLDAPVSGSVSLARTGGLTIMVGGDAADLDGARPILERLARRVFHLGPLGSGAVMKLAVNTLIFGLNGAVAEGLVLAERNGIDRAPRLRRSRGERRRRPDGRLQARRVPRPRRDAGRVLARARRQGPAPHPASSRRPRVPPCHKPPVNLDVIHAAERSVGEDADFSAVATHLRANTRGDHR